MKCSADSSTIACPDCNYISICSLGRRIAGRVSLEHRLSIIYLHFGGIGLAIECSFAKGEEMYILLKHLIAKGEKKPSARCVFRPLPFLGNSHFPCIASMFSFVG